MATQTGSISIDFKGDRADTVFLKPLFLGMEAMGMFRVMTNVVHKKKVGFVGVLDDILQKNTGCGFTPMGNLDMYERTVEVEDIKVNLEQCSDELENTIWEESLRKGVDQNNLTGTALSNIALLRIRQGIQLGCERLFWYGDKSSLSTKYNMLDGMWTVHIPALVAAPTNATPYISSGSGAPLAQDDATELLKNMWEAQDLTLLGIPDSEKRFYVSRSVYQGYMSDLELNGGGDAGRSALINGQSTLAFRAIALIQMPYWDQYDTVDFNAPNTHRALLTTPTNLVVATDLQSSKNVVKIWFEEKEETTNYKVKFKLGTSFVHPMLMVAAY